LERHSEAYESYQQAASLAPEDEMLWRDLGWAAAAAEQYEEAVAAYDQSLDREANAPDLWMWRSRALRALGRLDEAQVSIDRALNLAPTNGELWDDKGVLYLDMRQTDAALACIDLALAADPEYEAALRLLAFVGVRQRAGVGQNRVCDSLTSSPLFVAARQRWGHGWGQANACALSRTPLSRLPGDR
jgi:tetratricopeptide (TPR) repeat protein